MSVTTITDADLERLGLERFGASTWRKRRPGRSQYVTVSGGVRIVGVVQDRDITTDIIYLDHIKTPEELEALCAVVLGDFRAIIVTDRQLSIFEWLRRLFGGRQ